MEVVSDLSEKYITYFLIYFRSILSMTYINYLHRVQEKAHKNLFDYFRKRSDAHFNVKHTS